MVSCRDRSTPGRGPLLWRFYRFPSYVRTIWDGLPNDRGYWGVGRVSQLLDAVGQDLNNLSNLDEDQDDEVDYCPEEKGQCN